MRTETVRVAPRAASPVIGSTQHQQRRAVRAAVRRRLEFESEVETEAQAQGEQRWTIGRGDQQHCALLIHFGGLRPEDEDQQVDGLLLVRTESRTEMSQVLRRLFVRSSAGAGARFTLDPTFDSLGTLTKLYQPPRAAVDEQHVALPDSYTPDSVLDSRLDQVLNRENGDRFCLMAGDQQQMWAFTNALMEMYGNELQQYGGGHQHQHQQQQQQQQVQNTEAPRALVVPATRPVAVVRPLPRYVHPLNEESDDDGISDHADYGDEEDEDEYANHVQGPLERSGTESEMSDGSDMEEQPADNGDEERDGSTPPGMYPGMQPSRDSVGYIWTEASAAPEREVVRETITILSPPSSPLPTPTAATPEPLRPTAAALEPEVLLETASSAPAEQPTQPEDQPATTWTERVIGKIIQQRPELELALSLKRLVLSAPYRVINFKRRRLDSAAGPQHQQSPAELMFCNVLYSTCGGQVSGSQLINATRFLWLEYLAAHPNTSI
jgi:hypothetical protein